MMIPEVISLKPAIALLTSALSLMPSGARALMMEARVSAPFSRTPAVKTIASTLPPSSR